jgi:hypothetical protein
MSIPLKEIRNWDNAFVRSIDILRTLQNQDENQEQIRYISIYRLYTETNLDLETLLKLANEQGIPFAIVGTETGVNSVVSAPKDSPCTTYRLTVAPLMQYYLFIDENEQVTKVFPPNLESPFDLNGIPAKPYNKSNWV